MSFKNNTMEIVSKKIKISEIVKGYDWDTISEDKNIFGYDGKLRIQPEFQRNFCYEEEEQRKLIYSILWKFPINAIYFYQPDNKKEYYELLDGQQRIVSICNFFNNGLSIDTSSNIDKEENLKLFEEISDELQKKFLNYELDVYICKGTYEDRIDWFKIINIGNKKLEDQEILNSNISPSEWLEDAKSFFSRKNNGPAYILGNTYLKGDPNRQKYLETILSWYIEYENKNKEGKWRNIQEFMNIKKKEKNAEELKTFFNKVIDWIKKTFPFEDKKSMEGYDWGRLYSKYWNQKPLFSRAEIEEIKDKCFSNNDFKNSGIYEFVFTGDERVLQNRGFSDPDKQRKYKEQNEMCNHCNEKFKINEMDGDHIKPLSKGGKTEYGNLQMLCKKCNQKKSNKWIE